MKFLKTALILMFLLACNLALSAAIPASELQALIDLYNSTNGAGWYTKTNWLGAASMSGHVWMMPFRSSQASIKHVVNRGIHEYLMRFSGACFAKYIQIGDIGLFWTEINKNLNDPIVGCNGQNWIQANAPTAKAVHHTWDAVGRTADLYFPFDPNSPTLTMAQRQTMMHEVTHHIEWLRGVKEDSKGGTNPRAERNTNYQDKVVDALVSWSMMEDDIISKRRTLMEGLAAWKDLEKTLTDLEAGSGAGGHRPDGKLKSMTGFNADIQTIKDNYLKTKCGDDFRILVMVADMVPRMDFNLHVEGPPEATLGDTVSIKAIPWNSSDFAEVEIPLQLQATFLWKMSDGNERKGKSINVKPIEAKPYKMTVELVVPFGGKDYGIAQGDYELAVKPAPENTPSLKKNFNGKYRGRLKGDLEGSFEFTIANNYNLEGHMKSSVQREITGYIESNGKIHGAFVNKDKGPDYKIYTFGTFPGQIKGREASGEWSLYEVKNASGVTSRGDWKTEGFEEQLFSVAVAHGISSVAEDPPNDWDKNPDAAKWKELRSGESLSINPNTAFAVRTPADSDATVKYPYGLTFVVKSKTNAYFMRNILWIKVGEVYFNEKKIDSPFKIPEYSDKR